MLIEAVGIDLMYALQETVIIIFIVVTMTIEIVNWDKSATLELVRRKEILRAN